MRRLITYLDALFVGMLLGLIFVTVMHASPLRSVRALHTTGHDGPSLLEKRIEYGASRVDGPKAD